MPFHRSTVAVARPRYGRLLLIPFALILQRIAAQNPAATERVYSRAIFPFIGQALNFLTGWIPFSWAELTVWVLGLSAVFWILNTLWRIWCADDGDRLTILWRRVAHALVWAAGVYFWFIVLWGLNYSRLPFGTAAGLTVRPSSTAELAELCTDLISRANALRLTVQEDASGVMRLNDSTGSALKRTVLGYREASATYPVLGGRYGRPKGVISSRLWSYTGIAGVYFPYTGEANVNTAMPAPDIPAAAMHEMAHQRGFAREDEANYIAYLTCKAHPDADFRYSGMLSAVSESMYALYQRDPEKQKELSKLYSDGVRRDLKAEYQFWSSHEGPVSNVSDRINDKYLKSNGQTDGVQSYGRMVDLLLAEYRQSKGK